MCFMHCVCVLLSHVTLVRRERERERGLFILLCLCAMLRDMLANTKLRCYSLRFLPVSVFYSLLVVVLCTDSRMDTSSHIQSHKHTYERRRYIAEGDVTAPRSVLSPATTSFYDDYWHGLSWLPLASFWPPEPRGLFIYQIQCVLVVCVLPTSILDVWWKRMQKFPKSFLQVSLCTSNAAFRTAW